MILSIIVSEKNNNFLLSFYFVIPFKVSSLVTFNTKQKNVRNDFSVHDFSYSGIYRLKSA